MHVRIRSDQEIDLIAGNARDGVILGHLASRAHLWDARQADAFGDPPRLTVRIVAVELPKRGS